jgi:hypothetical protein
MSDPLVNVMFDAASLAMGKNLQNFAPILDPEMNVAMQEIALLLKDTAVANTWTAFTSPSGQLASSIEGVVVSPYEADLQVGVPYAARLEFGFNAVDSLGRSYNNAAEPYAMPALISNEDKIMQLVGLAMAEAFAKAGGK